MTMQEQLREFSFCQPGFRECTQYIVQKSGIRLADSKDSMVYSRLARRLRALKIASVSAYLKYLEANKTEEQQFINALTTNLTSFYREKHHFPI